MSQKPYKLYYWPMLQGRGEFVRLVLEEAGADYEDVARKSPESGGGIPALLKRLKQDDDGLPPLAPPILQAGTLTLAQMPNICLYLAKQHNLLPTGEGAEYHANQLMLTIADLVNETHDTHHPVATGQHYEEQKPEASKRAAGFLLHRAPKFLGYFERVLRHNKASQGKALLGENVSYVDLAMFQVLAGLAFAFPKRMKTLSADVPLLMALEQQIAQRPHIAAYLASERRIAFNNDGLFRCYPELDFS